MVSISNEYNHCSTRPPFSLVCPNVISLAGELLSTDGVVHQITYSFGYFLFIIG